MATSQPKTSLKLILKHTNVLNGLIPIEIENLDSIYDGEYNKHYKFILSYKFNLQNSTEESTWTSIKFLIRNISSKNKFVMKLPLYLLSYSIEFNLQIKAMEYIHNHTDNDSDNIHNKCKWKIITNTTSDNQIINVPSILIESQFHNDDHIQYCVPNAGFVRAGTILDISANKMVKILTDSGYAALNYRQDIVIVHVSKLYRYPTEGIFIVDITNRTKAETDLILKTTDNNNINVYNELCDILSDFCILEMNDMETEHFHYEFMNKIIAMNIYYFLFDQSYSYRIQCVFGNSFLFYEEQWKYHILRTYNALKKGNMSMQEVQGSRDGFGYTCDICRVELSWYDYMYHCGCEHQHDFCLTCIHSIMQQHKEMKEFLSGILNKIINDDCIQEILTFCVGNVIEFDENL
eukprot:284875_1